MSLKKNPQEELFTAANELKDFLPDDYSMMVFSKTIYSAFKDEDFADCYSTKGRNAKSPSFLALVTLLQFRVSLSDTKTSEACVRRLDWKIALHLPIDQKDSFDPSTLCYFRKRLKENDKISLIFDKVLALAQKKGFIKRKTKQRIDATHIISHINRISTTDLLFRAVNTFLCSLIILNRNETCSHGIVITVGIVVCVAARSLEVCIHFSISKLKRVLRMYIMGENPLSRGCAAYTATLRCFFSSRVIRNEKPPPRLEWKYNGE